MRKMLFSILFLSVEWILGQSCPCGENINLFVNGDFETDALSPSVTQMSEWNVNCNEVFGCYNIISSTSEVGGQFNGWPHGGAQFMFVDGQDNSPGNIPQTVWEQTVNCLIPGETYSFKFWLLGCSGFGDIFVLDAEVDANGTTTWLNQNTLINTMMPNSLSPLNWQQYSFNWIATAETATFRLEQISFNSSGMDFALDDIRLIGDSGMELNALLSTTDVGCDGSAGSLLASPLNGSGLFQFELMQNGISLEVNGTGFFDVEAPGDFVIRISDAQGCETSLNANIGQSAIMEVDFTLTPPTCSHTGQVEIEPFGGTPPYEVTVDGVLTDSLSFEITEGEWDVQVVDSNGCLADSILVASVDQPVIADFDFDLTDGVISTNNTSQNANSFLWLFDGDTISVAANVNEFELTEDVWEIQLMASDSVSGCFDLITKFVVVEDDFQWYVPNCITADGDGINDVFLPRCSSEQLKYYELRIFNRWGECVFTTNNPQTPWYGQVHNGEYYAQDNCYVWQLKYSRSDSIDDNTLEGHVTLIR